MAKNRFINTKFWSDSWVIELDPVEKLLLLYLLTNEHTNIAGIYELPIRIMAFETGIDKEMILKVFERFEKLDKVHYIDNWVYIVNFVKHQHARGSSKVKIGIENVKKEIPKEISDKIAKISKVAITHARGIKGVSALDSDLDTDIDIDNSKTAKAVTVKKERLDIKLVDYFFELKTWDTKNPPKRTYASFIKASIDLLDVCDNNLEVAKKKLKNIQEWADSRELDWSIETVFKKWYEVDSLKPKEKQPFIEGCRAFQKGGNWHVINKDGTIVKYIGSIKKLEYR